MRSTPGLRRRCWARASLRPSVTAPASGKAKHKRKVRLPKNYVPGAPVDPERWLPLRDRASYRKSKKGGRATRDRDMSKGASQGAAPAPSPGKEKEKEGPKPSTDAASAGGAGKRKGKGKGK